MNPEMRWMQMLAALLLLGAASTTHAWGVLGCTFGLDVESFQTCVNTASSSAVNAVKATYEETIGNLEDEIEALESSPLLAGLPGEQAALLALREMPIEALNACLAENDLNLGAVMSGAAANPVAFTQARLNELLNASVARGDSLLGPSLQGLAQGQVPADTPQAVAALADQAYLAMVELAEQDPVARCALPMITPLAAQIKAAAIAAYNHARSTGQALVEQTVGPVLDQAMMASLGTMLDGMRGQAPSPRRQTPVKQAPKQVPKQMSERVYQAPPRREPQKPGGPVPGNSKTVEERVVTEKPPVRTRSIRGDAVAWAKNKVMPDDVRRIALAVFTESMLDPGRMKALTDQINALSAALANGSADGFDTTDLDKLVDELAVPPDEMAAHIGVETARFYGHWTLDKAGGAIVDIGIGSVSAADALAKEVAAVICAIGHVPVEGGCASVKGIASFLYLQLGVPAIRWAMMAGFHEAWDQTVNCASQAIRAGMSPAGISTATCGPLGPLARQFPSGEELIAFVLPEIDASRASLFAYQQAVRNLATVSSNTATAGAR